MPGVRELVDEVRLEVLIDDGARLVVLVDPLGPGAAPTRPGADPPGRRRAEPTTTGASACDARGRATPRPASSASRQHYPFERVNPRLVFDRAAADGFRLDLPAGSTERWAPGETRTVGLGPVAR